jgi:very-short-patch-repair endonuclease
MGPVWEPALADAMQKAGIEFFQQYPTCGRYLDFAILRGELKLNIEVDGESYHRDSTGQRISADLQRDQVLIANGWKILRFWVYELREDMERCLEKIKATTLTHQNK